MPIIEEFTYFERTKTVVTLGNLSLVTQEAEGLNKVKIAVLEDDTVIDTIEIDKELLNALADNIINKRNESENA